MPPTPSPGSRPDPAPGPSVTPAGRVSFDDQAGSFETRVGMPEHVLEQIAAAVQEYAGLDSGDLLVELGAGTGLIGQWLTRLPIRYLGLELSGPMLAVFRPRLPPGDRAQVQQADANQRWPVADGTARAVFGSRVFQLFEVDHLVREANRVGRPDRAVLLHGRPVLGPGSPKQRARLKLQELMRRRGYEPRPAEQRLNQIYRYAVEQGGTRLPTRTVATWPQIIRPPDLLARWRGKNAVGGINCPADVAAEVLSELADWLAASYADPAEPVTSEERYILDGVQLRR